MMHLLESGGDVLLFQCRSRKSRDGVRRCEVSFRRLTFDHALRRFHARTPRAHPIHTDTNDSDILHCACAVDQQHAQKLPFVLLRSRSASAFTHLLFSIHGSVASLQLQFLLPHHITHVSILHGPIVLWRHGSSVFYTSPRAGGVKELPLSSITFIAELPLQLRRTVVHGFAEEEQRGRRSVTYLLDEERMVSGAAVLPEAYGTVVRCVVMLSAEETGGLLWSKLLAATSSKQLLRFQDGLPRDVCALPFQDPEKIQLLHTLSGCLILVSFSQGHVCAVCSQSFQVVSCWSAVRRLLVDDFVGCGADQMLLVFEDTDDSSDVLNSFLLTDLCAITYSCGRSSGEALTTSDTVQENLHLTVQALESRLQSGLRLLEDLHRDVWLKERVLHRCLVALTGLVSGQAHATCSPQQEGLVPLCDEDEEEDEDAAAEPEVDGMELCAEASLQVEKVWQRVVGSSLVVGVAVTLRDGCRLSGSVLEAMSSKSVSYPGRESRLTVVVVTDVAPLLLSGDITSPIMLHYSTEGGGAPARVCVACGRISLGLTDVTAGTFQPRLLQEPHLVTEEAQEDAVCLRAVLECVCVLVECVDQTLADVQDWMQERLLMRRLKLYPRCFASSSGDVLLRWERNTAFQGLLSICCRDELRLLQLLHSLCDFLPVSHDIKLLEGRGLGILQVERRSPEARKADGWGLGRVGGVLETERRGLVALETERRSPGGGGGALTLALEAEIQTLRDGVRSVLRSAEGEAEQEEASGSSDLMQRLRDERRREKLRLDKKLRPLVDRKRYCSLTHSLILSQIHTDEVTLTETPHSL